MDIFNKLLNCNGTKMIYLKNKEDKGVVIITLVVFMEIQKENQIEGSYILQLKAEESHYLEVGNDNIQKFRGIGIGRFLIKMFKFYTYILKKKVLI